MKKISTLLLVTAMAISHQAYAQKIMTLHDCMEYAVANSTKIKIRETENSDAQIGRRDAILKAFTPSISAGSYAFSNFGRTVDPETNTYINTTSFNNGYSVSAGIMLFDGFSALNNMRISKTALKMGVSKEQQLRDEICLATMEAYYNAVFYTQMLSVLELYVNTAKTNLELVRKQKELGQKGYADVVQMEAELADREYQAIDMGNKRADALLTLKDIMLWPVKEELAIDVSMTEDTLQYGKGNDGASFEEMSDFAKSYLPKALVAKDKMDNASTELNTAKWQLAPTLSLNAGWSTSYYTYPGMKGYTPVPFGTQFRNNGGEYVQFSLNIPIYDRLSRYSDISKKKNALKRANAEYEQTLHDIETEVAKALQEREGAMAALAQARKRSDMQEEAFRLNKSKMAQGLISAIEFQTASNSYLNAKAERLNAMLKYYLKNSVVQYYQGISYLEQ